MDSAAAPNPGRRSGATAEKAGREFRMEIAHGLPTASVRRTVSQVLGSWCPSHPPDDALLVITELVQNLSRHTAGDGELHVAVGEDSVLIEVTDTDPRPPVLREHHARRLSGRGLIIVDGVARRWGCRPASGAARDGKVVWAELDPHPLGCACHDAR